MSMLGRFLARLLSFRSSQEEFPSLDIQLLCAAGDGDVESLSQYLQTEDVNVNCTDQQGSTPLHLAIKGDHSRCVEVLLQHPIVSLTCKNRWGRTPAHSAVVWQRLNILKRLVEHDPDILSEVDFEGKTILHLACASGALSQVKYLLTQKVNVNALDHRKWSPLMCAVAIQQEVIVLLLLKNSADCNSQYNHSSGIGPLKLAIEKHNFEIVEILLHNGAMVEFCVTMTMGSYGETGHRQTVLCHNLATAALENIDLLHPQSINIALLVVQASPTAPDEDACLKVYEQLVRPSRRIRRSMSRELIHLVETISDTTVDKIMRLLSMAFAVGVDVSKSNVERLTRKFRLEPEQDGRLFDLMRSHRSQSLKLKASLVIRQSLIKAGHANVLMGVIATNFPSFLREMVLLERW